MALIDYTTYAEIRAVLGVSDEELEDADLALPIRNLELEMAFDEVSPNLLDFYDIALAANPKSPSQRRLVRAVPVFAAYAVAIRLLASLPLFAPKKITDGRAEFERIADPYKHLREELGLALDNVIGIIKDALEDLGEIGPTLSPQLFAMSSRTLDPVTGVSR